MCHLLDVLLFWLQVTLPKKRAWRTPCHAWKRGVKGKGVGRVGGGGASRTGQGTGNSMRRRLSKLPFSKLPFSFALNLASVYVGPFLHSSQGNEAHKFFLGSHNEGFWVGAKSLC